AGVQGHDRVEGARDRVGVARELHARRVGEELALARNGSPDRARGQRAGKADERHRRGEDRGERRRAALVARRPLGACRGEKEPLGLVADPGEARKQRGEAQVERHVAVQDVAEFVPMTPCSSSRESFSTAPAVTTITASFGEYPATRALIASSRRMTYTGGTETPDAIDISSTTLRSLRSAGEARPGST